MTIEIIITFLVRLALIGLFFPFSALDKVLNFNGAVSQARQIGVGRGLGMAMILIGLTIEVVMSLGVLTGVADRLAAFILAGYCAATAVLYKQFWTAPAFSLRNPGDQFWDFLKNFAVAGGFLLITFGTTANGVQDFFSAPLSSTQPYAIGAQP
ncbi:DoxX family protein [Devosia sp.]|uniref:DoxX family protein n=1 Tax=Devosia sp. TaxID=1871048 RepID=UPI003A91FC8C